MRKAYPEGVERAKRVLLEVAEVIEMYNRGVYIIGGQTIGLIYEEDGLIKQRGTQDIDLLLDTSILRPGLIADIIHKLYDIGFAKSPDKEKYKLTKVVDGYDVELDLIIPDIDNRTAVYEGIEPVAIPAAELVKDESIEKDLSGIKLRIPGPGIAIILKIIAYHDRKKTSDLIDFYYLLYYHDDIEELVSFIKPLLNRRDIKEGFVALKRSLSSGDIVDEILAYIISYTPDLSNDEAITYREDIRLRIEKFINKLFE